MSIKVLYIEDSNLNIRLIEKLVRTSGYDFVAAKNGYSGIEAADAEKPDIILLDINLPDIDGYEVIYHLRESNRINNIPIIALTSDITNYKDCMSAGFDGYLNKPVSRKTLQSILQKFITEM